MGLEVLASLSLSSSQNITQDDLHLLHTVSHRGHFSMTVAYGVHIMFICGQTPRHATFDISAKWSSNMRPIRAHKTKDEILSIEIYLPVSPFLDISSKTRIVFMGYSHPDRSAETVHTQPIVPPRKEGKGPTTTLKVFEEKYVNVPCSKPNLACSSIDLKPVVQLKELEISRDNVRLVTKLGSGFYGEVWKGVYLNTVDVAVKTRKIGTMTHQEFLDEARTMHHLRHRRLVQLLGVVSTEETSLIMMEFMAHGALRYLLQSEDGRKLSLTTLIGMNTQIAEGMAHLESANCIHRDLHAANILVGENYVVKIADFGLARFSDNGGVLAAEDGCRFPIRYAAPEAVLRKEFSVKSDVWSFGLLMYEIITFGKKPYSGIPAFQAVLMVEIGHRMEKPTNDKFEIPDSYYEMMLTCWQKIPRERPTFKSIHTFFDNYLASTSAEAVSHESGGFKC